MIVKIDVNTGKMSEFKLALPYKEGERKEPFYPGLITIILLRNLMLSIYWH